MNSQNQYTISQGDIITITVNTNENQIKFENQNGLIGESTILN